MAFIIFSSLAAIFLTLLIISTVLYHLEDCPQEKELFNFSRFITFILMLCFSVMAYMVHQPYFYVCDNDKIYKRTYVDFYTFENFATPEDKNNDLVGKKLVEVSYNEKEKTEYLIIDKCKFFEYKTRKEIEKVSLKEK
jgi:hypothetical protein